ncbi:MAG: VanZ family protein [Bifidobacteriaceae bacterium]|jgi:glycopeptide antibiotics resistance protein|nr:VanZ family protein [Bifidobacteriaceae bacterium]
MEKRFSSENVMIYALFAFYLFVLTWAILWKFNVPYIGDGTERVINMIPFHANSDSEMRFNVFIFIPFGFYISAITSKPAVDKQILITFLTSTAFEALQYILAIGRSDITDIILNTFGGIIGILAFSLTTALFGKRTCEALLILSIIITALCLLVVAFFIMFVKFV